MAKKDLTPKQTKALVLMVGGATQILAAAEVGVHPNTINTWMKLPDFRNELEGMMARIRMNFESRAMVVGSNALVRVDKHIKSPDDNTSLKATNQALSVAARIVSSHKQDGDSGDTAITPMIVLPVATKMPWTNKKMLDIGPVIDVEVTESDESDI